MKEIELKILEIDVKKLEKKLVTLGAKKILPLTLIREMVFDSADGKIQKNKELFRLRQEGQQVYLTYKYGHKNKGHFRTNQELEVFLNDFDATRKMLLQLGYTVLQEREKQRLSYKLGKVRIEIDKYPPIPAYTEFEGPEKQTKALLKKLDIDLKDTVTFTVKGVLEHYKKNKAVIKF